MSCRVQASPPAHEFSQGDHVYIRALYVHATVLARIRVDSLLAYRVHIDGDPIKDSVVVLADGVSVVPSIARERPPC